MKNLKTIVGILAITTSLSALAVPKVNDTTIPTMVPKGKIDHKGWREYKVKTEAGTKVEIEYDRKGELSEASGDHLNKGDNFEPGQGFISLSTAAQSVTKAGNILKDEWEFEKDSKYGWVYTFEGERQGNALDFMVDAKTGAIVKAED